MNIPDVSGIYAIINTTNGKRYVGSSKNIRKRWSAHLLSLRKDIHHAAALQRAWNKYGEKTFSISILEECPVGLLAEKEQFYMDERADYNSSPTAFSCLGFKQSEETKTKHSLRMRKLLDERPEFVEHIRSISKMPKSEDWKRQLSERMRGVKKSASQVEKMAKSRAEMTAQQVLKVVELRRSGMTVKAIAAEVGSGFGKIQRLLDGKSYRWVEGIPSVEELRSLKIGNGKRGCPVIYEFHHPELGTRKCTQLEFREEFPEISRPLISATCVGNKRSFHGWRVLNPRG